jgi:hypothetical protein
MRFIRPNDQRSRAQYPGITDMQCDESLRIYRPMAGLFGGHAPATVPAIRLACRTLCRFASGINPPLLRDATVPVWRVGRYCYGALALIRSRLGRLAGYLPEPLQGTKTLRLSGAFQYLKSINLASVSSLSAKMSIH